MRRETQPIRPSSQVSQRQSGQFFAFLLVISFVQRSQSFTLNFFIVLNFILTQSTPMSQYIKNLSQVTLKDINTVGGKNASLGEMISNLSQTGVKVPGGFATTIEAFNLHLQENGIGSYIENALKDLDTNNIAQLTQVGKDIRQKVIDAPLPQALSNEITVAYKQMCAKHSNDNEMLAVAVRSSATAEDLPNASFAGQQETYLNVCGIEQVLLKIREVFASLYNDRAISYRVHQGFVHSQVGISAGVQLMVRSDLASSGVMFTIDTESGFEDVVFITAAYGLGEMVVQGAVNPDEFYVYKTSLQQGKKSVIRRVRGQKSNEMVFSSPGANDLVSTIPVLKHRRRQFSISDSEAEQLATYAMMIEKHYQRPMDIEWAKDGLNGELFIVQARPETVASQQSKKYAQVIRSYELTNKQEVLLEGRAIGQLVGSGKVKIINSPNEMDRVEVGDVLVADMTDPDWEPVMKRTAGIITNRGGRTCHAAIIARELGIPAIVGTNKATEVLTDDSMVTVSCCEGDTGFVYKGKASISIKETPLKSLPELSVDLMLNVGNPDKAFGFSRLPNKGVGLARLEFIIARNIGVHPSAILKYPNVPPKIKKVIDKLSAPYGSAKEFYISKIVEGVATIAAAFAPKPVIVRMSDFKSNEYAELVGGDLFEPHEENPMIGFRGASRYIADSFQECWEMECTALKRVRNDIGLTNVKIMVPFVRTLSGAEKVINLLAKNGLKRGENELQIIMMCEVPSNAILAEEFLEYFDGFSIGSNDLTQLTLALDRDSGIISHMFDERNPAVKFLLERAISACTKKGKYIGICGQGPSDYPDFAQWLFDQGIDSISLNPDSVIETWLQLIDKK